MRGRLLRIVLVGLATACGGASSDAPVPGRAPDVVLISIDTLRPDHLGCYGYARDTSPTIDRLAAEGVRFENAVSTTSWTLPAHAAMFTGLYDSAHGLVDNGLRLGDEHITLAEVFSQAGYRTAGFYGGPYLHPTFGLAQGFDVYQSCMTALPEELPDQAIRLESRSPRGASHRDVTGPRTHEKVRTWARTLDARPVFLFVHLWDVHYDFIAPRSYVELFDPDYTGELTGENFMGNPAVRPGMPARDFEHLIALYDAEIRFTDDILSRLLQVLDDHGRLRDAIVVITADHGEEFFEHGRKGHQKTLYDEVLRVPLVIRWPGRIPGGRVVGDQVRLVDLLPTLAELAGVRLGFEVQGRSLAPLLFGSSLPPEPALAELHVDGRGFRALRTNRSKLIDYAPLPRRQLFDLERDPGEQQPLSPRSPAFEPAWQELERTSQATLAFAKRLGERSVGEIELDPELVRRLDELGYLGEAEPEAP